MKFSHHAGNHCQCIHFRCHVRNTALDILRVCMNVILLLAYILYNDLAMFSIVLDMYTTRKRWTGDIILIACVGTTSISSYIRDNTSRSAMLIITTAFIADSSKEVTVYSVGRRQQILIVATQRLQQRTVYGTVCSVAHWPAAQK